MALNRRYNHNGKEKEIKEDVLEREFGQMSLEYKHTDRPVDFPMLTRFTPEDIRLIGPLEHERWLKEHIAMGWVYSEAHLKLSDINNPESEIFQDKQMREQTRGHHDMVSLKNGEELTYDIVKQNFTRIGGEEQAKDTEPMNSMLELIKKYDGLRIYRYKLP